MTVNLPIIDTLLAALKEHLEAQTFEAPTESLNLVFAEIYNESAQFLKDQIKAVKDPTLAGESSGPIQLSSLQFREERGFGFSNFRVPVKSPEELEFFHSHFIEILPPQAPARLLKVRIYWQHKAGSLADYSHESFKLLKPLMALEAEALISQLEPLKGHKIDSGSFISRIEIHDLGQNRTLEI
ncbi:hypothetical protein AZI86_15345 [Bdellovibrio bacteriovorus]|uniref:Uncharacterized protein n=2 Tax=Bdellovibrio bacteriovorus TaxID=959 RepID=A0A150WHG1_BDEBC|nr:hypothetical protein AZI86_15345 [Bdellovibrio bacteriovorus]